MVVGSYDTYREADDVVALLKNPSIRKQWASIVPRDIVLVETEGEMNPGRAVALGASAGGLLGLLTGVFSGMFNWVTPAGSHVWAAGIAMLRGTVFGGVIGRLAHWAGQDSRTAQEGERWEAGRCDVVTDEANADEARRILRDRVGAGASRVFRQVLPTPPDIVVKSGQADADRAWRLTTMEPGEGNSETGAAAAAAARPGRGPSSQEVRETSRQVLWALLRLVLVMVAAFLGAMAVEAARALF